LSKYTTQQKDAQQQKKMRFSTRQSLLWLVVLSLFNVVVLAVPKPSFAEKQPQQQQQEQPQPPEEEENLMVWNTMETSDKTSWPELVGMTGLEAQQEISVAHPDWKVQVIPEGSIVTMDFRLDRVRIYVNPNDGNKVVKAPCVG
jgi:Potato inhibitor I family